MATAHFTEHIWSFLITGWNHYMDSLGSNGLMQPIFCCNPSLSNLDPDRICSQLKRFIVRDLTDWAEKNHKEFTKSQFCLPAVRSQSYKTCIPAVTTLHFDYKVTTTVTMKSLFLVPNTLTIGQWLNPLQWGRCRNLTSRHLVGNCMVKTWRDIGIQ